MPTHCFPLRVIACAVATPFDMTVLNDRDRFHLVMDVVARVPALSRSAAGMALIQRCEEKLQAHRAYVNEYGDDVPEIRNWRWAISDQQAR